MYSVSAIASITHQDSFKSEDVNANLTTLSEESQLITPDYKEYIAPAALRRLSPILRMAIAAAKACHHQTKAEFEAISIGTSLGCLTDTEKFLTTIHTVTGDVLSPTAFIQSTHNTIAGQVSLELQNHCYNMTHTQTSLSFEVALLDGMMCCAEGFKHVLVGAADEAIPFLQTLTPLLFSEKLPLTSGTTMLVLNKTEKSEGVSIVACKMVEGGERTDEIALFLQENGLLPSHIDRLYTSDPNQDKRFNDQLNYTPFTGQYHSSSAFATHMAIDWLRIHGATHALIVNASCPGKIGLILVKNHDASC